MRLSWLPLLLPLGPYAAAQAPVTTPERTEYRETSRLAEVRTFLESLEPVEGIAFQLSAFGTSVEGRSLPLVRVEDAARPFTGLQDERLRLLVIGNIHAGEVEGKEALQEVLRELSAGEHRDLLEHAVLFLAPVYNADGNERISKENRVTQNGPEQGVGERANAQGLDLNRDFIKAESPECQALLMLFNELDPHLFMDLHTTNGTYHGYHLTYAPSLSSNADPDLDRFAHQSFLPEVTAKLGQQGWRIYHYGNAGRQRDQWVTYDHRPRFGTNYYGLRGRLAVLSEAYSYLDFPQRIAVTKAFVLQILRSACSRRDELRRLCAQADQRALEGGLEFGSDTQLVEGQPGEILMGEIDEVELEGLGTRRVARDVHEPVSMRVRVRFEAGRRRPLPKAWALVDPPPAVVQRLRWHGVRMEQLAEQRELPHQRFEVDSLRRSPRLFQGHHEMAVEGRWVPGSQALPAGTLWIPAAQPLAKVAAQLLEPESEDSLLTWNLWGDRVKLGAEGEPGAYPVLHLYIVPE